MATAPVMDSRISMQPLGRRPRTWFGPEDWDGQDADEIEFDIKERTHRQDVWDEKYRSMSFLQRLFSTLRGEVTEPVENRPVIHAFEPDGSNQKCVYCGLKRLIPA